MQKYFRLLLIEIKKVKQYALNFIGQLVYLPIQLLIIYFIWKYAFSGRDFVGGYSFQDMIAYYFLLAIFQSAITPMGVIAYEVWVDINQGKLNLYLSRPIFYPLYVFFNKLGYFIWGMLSGLVFLFFIQLLIPLGTSFRITNICFSLISAVNGLLIFFCLFFSVGALTFWVENVLTLRDNLWNVIRILSGQIFPIALFPGFLRNIAEVLPFQHIYYLPISIFQGKIPQGELVSSLINQFSWVVIMLIFAIYLWTVGTKKYSSQGG